MAGFQMRNERADHTWQPTVLLNELYLELIKIKSLPSRHEDPQEKQAFLRLCGFLMRRLLLRHARPLSKRVEKVAFETEENFDGTIDENESLVGIENLLSKLAAIEPRLRTIVELRVFEGCNNEEIADRLQCSTKTVTRSWNFAQRWLSEALAPSGELKKDQL